MSHTPPPYPPNDPWTGQAPSGPGWSVPERPIPASNAPSGAGWETGPEPDQPAQTDGWQQPPSPGPASATEVQPAVDRQPQQQLPAEQQPQPATQRQPSPGPQLHPIGQQTTSAYAYPAAPPDPRPTMPPRRKPLGTGGIIGIIAGGLALILVLTFGGIWLANLAMQQQQQQADPAPTETTSPIVAWPDDVPLGTDADLPVEAIPHLVTTLHTDPAFTVAASSTYPEGPYLQVEHMETGCIVYMTEAEDVVSVRPGDDQAGSQAAMSTYLGEDITGWTFGVQPLRPGPQGTSVAFLTARIDWSDDWTGFNLTRNYGNLGYTQTVHVDCPPTAMVAADFAFDIALPTTSVEFTMP